MDLLECLFYFFDLNPRKRIGHALEDTKRC
jgi:hypothetical protein